MKKASKWVTVKKYTQALDKREDIDSLRKRNTKF